MVTCVGLAHGVSALLHEALLRGGVGIACCWIAGEDLGVELAVLGGYCEGFKRGEVEGIVGEFDDRTRVVG